MIAGAQVSTINITNGGQDDIRMMIHNMKQNEDLQTSHIHAEFIGDIINPQTQFHNNMMLDTQEDQVQNDYE